MGASRKYKSPLREERASETRLKILESAEPLFVGGGYAGTSMAAIAKAAGISARTVYLHFPTKAELLRALWNLRLRGDAADAPVGQRDWFRAVLEEPDPAEQLRLNLRNSVAVKTRIGPLFRVIRDGAGGDPQVAELWGRIGKEFRANQLAVADSLDAKGALRAGLDAATAADILWSLNHPDYFELLTVQRGWSTEQYAELVGELLSGQLLR